MFKKHNRKNTWKFVRNFLNYPIFIYLLFIYYESRRPTQGTYKMYSILQHKVQ